MTTLPSQDDALNLDGDINTKRVYTMIFNAERAAETAQNATLSRIVGYLLLDPLAEALPQILEQVDSCHSKAVCLPEDSNTAIYRLGQHYLTHYIRPCKLRPSLSAYFFANIRPVRQNKDYNPAKPSYVSSQAFERAQRATKIDLM